MRTEISALFHLKDVSNLRPVSSCKIGDCIHIERLNEEWLTKVRNDCSMVRAREHVEWLTPYTHRLFYEVNADESAVSPLCNRVMDDEKELIVRAILLSRIVKPTSIGIDSAWVKSFYRSDGSVKHYNHQRLQNLNVAFVEGKAEEMNTITEADAVEMAGLWDEFNYFFNQVNRATYGRIIQAFTYHEYAYSTPFAAVSHVTLHAALESLICFGAKNNKAQFTQRLPKVMRYVSKSQVKCIHVSKKRAETIYNICCKFKHEAQPVLLNELLSGGQIHSDDKNRIGAIKLLRKAVRHILIEVLRNRKFANTIISRVRLVSRYRAFDQNGKLIK